MKKKFTFLLAAIALLTMMVLPERAVGQTRADAKVTITISSFTDLPSGNASYATYSWTQDGISGKATIFANTSSTSMQFNASNYLFYSTSEISGVIKSIKLTTASGTNRTYVVYGSTSAYSGSGTSYGTQIGSQTVTTSGTTYTVSSGEYTYFTIVKTGSGAGYLSSVEVTYTPSGGSSNYTVSYNANGATSGTVPTDSNSPYASGATVTVLGNTGSLAKTGHDWSGWCLNPEGTGTVYGPAYTTTYTISENTTFYAKWTAHTHNITSMPAKDEYGSYSASETTDIPYGTTVTLTFTPASGYENYDAAWSVNGTAISGNTFSMPDADVTVSVTLNNYVKDILNQSFTGVSGGYTYWTKTSNVSGAVYVGVSGGSSQSNYIQLNKGSYTPGYAGIVTTGSGGKAKKIVVTWNSSTQNGRVLNIYGSNSAYSGTSDLYNTNTDGDFLGTIVYGTSTELVISDDYEYIGIVTASNAAYLTEIDIYWEPSTDPIITADDIELSCDDTSGSIMGEITNYVEGTISASTEADWISNFTYDQADEIFEVDFTTTANPSTTAARTATVVLTFTYSNETTTKNVTVTQAAAPVIYTTIPALFNAATSTATNVNVTFGNWVVSGVSGSNAFVTDNNGNGFIIYTSNHGFVVNDKLSGTVMGTPLKLYNGSAEFTNLTKTTDGLSVSNDGTITVITDKTIANLGGVNTGAVVTLNNLTYDGTNLSDGTNTIKPYNTLYNGTFVNGNNYNVTGVYQQFGNTTKEILPRSAADIVEVEPQHEDYTLTISTDIYVEGLSLRDDDQGEDIDITDDEAIIQDGTTVTVNIVIDEGYVVDEITVTYGSEQSVTVTTDTPNSEYSFVMPAANATLAVTTKEAPVVTNYTLVSSQAQLMPGKHYIIVGSNAGETEYYAMGAQTTAGSNKIRTAVAVTKTGSSTIQAEDDVSEFVISGDATHGWAFYDTTSKMYLKAVNGNEIDQSETLLTDYCYWTIDYSVESAIELIQSNKYTDRFINFNNTTDPKRFANYKTSSNQRPVSIYVKDGDTDLEIYSPTTLSATNTICVPQNGTLRVKTNGSLACNNAEYLTVKEGAQVYGVSANVQATFQKDIEAYTDTKDGYYLIANPTTDNVTPTTANGLLTNNYDLYKFDQSHSGAEWRNYKAEEFDVLENRVGYLYANSGNPTLSFAGEIPTATTTGESPIALAYDAGKQFAGFNLVGNPFAVNITSMNFNTGDCSYYKITPSGTFVISSDPIKVGEAFMVQAAANTVLNLNPSAGKGFNNEAIRLEVSNGEFTDVAYVYFGNHLPLTKINHLNDEAPMLYIHEANADNAVAVYNERGEVKSINVNFEAKKMGTYTINAKMERGNVKYMHLYDRLTGIDTDLLESSYSFIGAKDDMAGRFILRFEESGNAYDSDMFAYQSGNSIIVSGEGELQVFDITGRKVMTTNINGVETINGMNRGVYIFRLNEKTQKIVVR